MKRYTKKQYIARYGKLGTLLRTEDSSYNHFHTYSAFKDYGCFCARPMSIILDAGLPGSKPTPMAYEDCGICAGVGLQPIPWKDVNK